MKLPVLAVILLLVAAPVVAQEVSMHDEVVDSIAMSGDVASAALQVDAIGLVANDQYPGRMEALRLHVQEGAYHVFTESGVVVDSGTGWGSIAQAIGQPEVERVPESGLASFKFDLAGLEVTHMANVVPGDARVLLQGPQVQLSPEPEGVNCMTQAGFVPSADCPGPLGDERPTRLPLPETYQYVRAADGASLKLVGAFVLELEGVDLDGDASIDAYDNPQPTTFEKRFVRFTVEKGQLDIDFSADMAHAALAVTDVVESTVLGQAHVDGDGVAGTWVGDFYFRTQRGGEGLTASTEMPVSPLGSPTASSAAISPMWAFLLIIPALIAFGVTRRGASMADIEEALREGKYTQAVRLSRRVLRVEPEHASAQLSEAIAFTKAGRPAKAVDAIRAFLAKSEPRDGTLHYVMGVALSELGRDAEARRAMRHAVARTPALASEVEMHLRPARYEGAYA